jgi:hypothetical protein
MPFRMLRFTFVSSGSGTELRGQWLLLRRIRIPVAIYLSLCIVSALFVLFGAVWIYPPNRLVNLIGPAAGFAMIYGWTWIGVVLSRKGEAQLVSAVYHAMDSDQSAKIVSELLSSPQ